LQHKILSTKGNNLMSSAPNVPIPNNSDQSTLASVVGNSAPVVPQYDPSQEQQTSDNLSGPQSSGGGSRLQAVLKAVANVVPTALAGVPAGGRPSFAGGLGQGARAEQAAQATAQDIKFKDFDNQVRAANLHNQDLELQLRTQDQQDAHQKAQDLQQDWDADHGIQYNPHPNDGDAVMQTWKAQNTTDGAATVAPGTHLSADGKSINVPSNSPETQQGLMEKYKTLQGVLPGLPALPNGATFVPPKNLDIMTHLLGGYDISGSPINHDQLPAYLAAMQSQRDALAKKGATPYQLGTIDSTIGILKAQQDALDTHAATVIQKNTVAKAQGEADVNNDPTNQQAAATGAGLKAGAVSNAEQPNKLALQNNSSANAAANKAGTGDWVPGVTADEKKKAELAENIAFNANEVAKIVMNRPDILGAVAGRFTNTQQMIGNNDPDISALGVHIHNMAMANSGVHGFRSQEGVESYEKQILNNFKNGPQAMAGALRASTGSIQTFIDNARPNTYKTHSSQGGAVRGMMENQ
jgi:hypothetical protein